MTLEESYRILGLKPGAKEKDRHRAYREMRDKLNAKQSNAPTPGLENKYREALGQIDEAIECVESSIDAKELPIFGGEVPEGEPVVADSDTDEVPLVAEATSEDVKDLDSSEGKSRRLLYIAGGVFVFVCLLLGVWKWQGISAEQERVRLVAEAEAARASEAARLAEETRRERAELKEKLRVELDVERASLKALLDMISDQIEKTEIRLNDLKGAERVAASDGTAAEQSLARYRRETYESFVKWLGKYMEKSPAKQRLGSAEEFSEKGEFKDALAAIGGEKLDEAVIRSEIAKEERIRYEVPVAKFVAKRDYARVLKLSKLATVQRDFEEAIEQISKFEKNDHVGVQAKAEMKRTRALKAKDVYEQAREAADLGELVLARSLLDSLDEDQEIGERTEFQTALNEQLNSEYALEQAVAEAERALASNDFEKARDQLKYLAEDKYVGNRVEKDLARIDELEEIWNRKANHISAAERPMPIVAPPEDVIPDQPPKLLSKVEPAYPDQLRRNQVSGYVELILTVEIDGTATGIEVLSSSRREFEEPAINAVKKWKFRPGRKNGTLLPAKVRQKITFNP